MAVTKLENLIDPEVMASAISSKLVDLIRFSPLAKIDTTLSNVPGSEIVLPKYSYIGDADDVAEGVDIGMSLLTASTTRVKVKKAAKGVSLTDEALLSAFDPMNEITSQLATSIAQKVDNDCGDALNSISAAMTVDDSTNTISALSIADALVKFGEDLDGRKVLLIAPAQLAQIRHDANFINASDLATDMLMKGSIGMIWGCEIQVSNKIVVDDGAYTNFIVKPEAVAIFLKRDIQIETQRNITNKTTLITADQHYTVHLLDDSKAIKFITKA